MLLEYTLKLSAEELNVVLSGLGELQLKASLSVFGKIQSQVQEQTATTST